MAERSKRKSVEEPVDMRKSRKNHRNNNNVLNSSEEPPKESCLGTGSQSALGNCTNNSSVGTQESSLLNVSHISLNSVPLQPTGLSLTNSGLHLMVKPQNKFEKAMQTKPVGRAYKSGGTPQILLHPLLNQGLSVCGQPQTAIDLSTTSPTKKADQTTCSTQTDVTTLVGSSMEKNTDALPQLRDSGFKHCAPSAMTQSSQTNQNGYPMNKPLPAHQNPVNPLLQTVSTHGRNVNSNYLTEKRDHLRGSKRYRSPCPCSQSKNQRLQQSEISSSSENDEYEDLGNERRLKYRRYGETVVKSKRSDSARENQSQRFRNTNQNFEKESTCHGSEASMSQSAHSEAATNSVENGVDRQVLSKMLTLLTQNKQLLDDSDFKNMSELLKKFEQNLEIESTEDRKEKTGATETDSNELISQLEIPEILDHETLLKVIDLLSKQRVFLRTEYKKFSEILKIQKERIQEVVRMNSEKPIETKPMMKQGRCSIM